MSDTKDTANSSEDAQANGTSSKPSTPHSKSGWDGKLRVNKQATLANPEALSDPDYSDEDAPPVDQIEADEGMSNCHPISAPTHQILNNTPRPARR